MTREEAKDYIREWCPYNRQEEIIEALEQEPKTGHWIMPKGDVKPFGDDTIQCDMCGFFTDVDCNYNFCPNCGAKMVEPQ